MADDKLKELNELINRLKEDASNITLDAAAAEAFAAAAEEAASHVDRMNALDKANAVLKAQINDLMDSSIEKQRKLEQIRGREMTATSRAQHNAQIAADLAEVGIGHAQEALQLQQLKLEGNIEAVDAARRSGDLNEEQLAVLEAGLVAEEKALQKLRESVAEREKSRDIAREQVAALDRLSDSTNNTLGMLGLSATAWDNSIFAGILGEGGTGMAAGFDALASTIGAALSPANLFAQLMTDIFHSTIQMVGAMDKAIASFNKQTGAAGEMDAVMYEVHAEMGPFAGTLSESASALTSLYTEMATFSNMNKAAQKEMGVLVAQLDRLGVNAGTSAKNLEVLTMSLGMTGKQAGSTLTDLTNFADQLNIPVNQVMENLNASMPVLAKYGKTGVDVFKKVEAAAKATGIATQDLISITQQFDTFQSAADAVGRLNGILGGNYLNSLEMVNMTEDERIRKLLGVIDLSGKSWESLGRHERQAIAAAAGINDMNQANKLFGAGVAGYDKMLAAQDKNADAAKRQAEMAKAAASAQEKYAAVMEQLSVAVKPIIDLLHGMLDVIMALNQYTGGAFIPVLFALIGAYYIMATAATAAGAASIALFLTQMKQAAANFMQLVSYQGLIATVKMYTVALLGQHTATLKALGVVGIMVGAYMLLSEHLGPVTSILIAATIAMIAYGIATGFAASKKMLLLTAVAALITAFVEPHSPPFYLLLPIIAAGLFLIGKASLAAAPGIGALGAVAAGAAIPILLLGVAFIVLGAGMMLMAIAVALIVLSIAALVMSFVELVKAIAPAAPQLMLFALALPIIAISGFYAGLGLIAFAVGMAALGISLLTVKTEDLQALATMFEGMGKAAEGGAGGMTSITEFLDVLQDVADDIDEDRLAALSAMFFGLSLISDIETAGFEAMGTFFESMGDLATDEVYGLAGALWELSYAMNNMPLFAPLTLAYMIDSLGDIEPAAEGTLTQLNKVIATASNIDDAKANNIEKVTESITDMVLELQGGLFTNTEDTKEILESLAKVFSGGEEKGGAKGGENKIILALDREGQKRLAEAVVPHMESLINKKYSIAKVRS